MNMNDMMGLLQQMKMRMNPDPGNDPGKGPGSMRIPGQLGGRGLEKDMPSPTSRTPGDTAGEVMMGAEAGNIEALQRMISQLRQQMNKPGISVEEQRALLQQIQQMEAQVQQLTQQGVDNMRMRPQGDGSVLRMGTRSSGRSPQPQPLPGSFGEWMARQGMDPIGGYGGGGLGTGGGGLTNPFAWMGQSRQGGALDYAGNPVETGIRRVRGGG